jgi:hypothetical protein
MERELQTVSPAGERITRLPEGMVVHDLVTHTDERGTVCELYDPRWGVSPETLVFAYLFTIRAGMAKGWGIHRDHDDRYAFLTVSSSSPSTTRARSPRLPARSPVLCCRSCAAGS